MTTAAPLPSEVEAALRAPRPDMAQIRTLYAHLDHDPLALSWPSTARIQIRCLLEKLERTAPKAGGAW